MRFFLFLFIFFLGVIEHLYAKSNVVKLFYWANTIPKSVFQDFEAETGLKVVSTMFDSDELLEAKLYAGLTGFDVIILSANPFLPNQLKAEFYQKLDKTKLPNYKHLDPNILKKLEYYDPGNQYAIPFNWGSAGMGVNLPKLKEALPSAPVGSWALFFEPATLKQFQKCGISMIDSPTEIFPLVLHYLGYRPNSLDLGHLEHATNHLKKLRPFIKEINNNNFISNLADGNLCLSVGWSGNIVQAKQAALSSKNKQDIRYVLGHEITPMWIDILALHNKAPNKEGGHQFLNFMMKPEIAARITNETNFANGNLSSREFINPDLLSDKVLFPDSDKIDQFYMDKPAPLRYEQKRVRAWEEFKSGVTKK